MKLTNEQFQMVVDAAQPFVKSARLPPSFLNSATSDDDLEKLFAFC